MNRITTFALLTFTALLMAQERKPLTLNAIFKEHHFKTKTLTDLKWQPDGKAFTWLEQNGKQSQVWQKSPGAKASLLLGTDTVSIDGYKWLDKNTVLLKTDERSIWRHSTIARYLVYDLLSKNAKKLLPENPLVHNLKIGPRGKQIAYVYENDLYLFDISESRKVRLTRDGSEEIISGAFDWVYEEEFGLDDGYRWSPDGSKISFWRFDQSAVPTYSWINYKPLNGAVETIRYPKAGQANAAVTLHIADVASGELDQLHVDAGDGYFPQMEWIDETRLMIQHINRKQNHLHLLLVHLNGAVDTLLTERADTWVDVHENWTLLSGERFIWTSERDGFNHIYLGHLGKKDLTQVTRGSWEVKTVYGSDGEYIYFQANKEAVSDYHIYKIKIDGGGLTRLVEQPGRHFATFSGDFRHFVDRWSAVDHLPRYDLRDNSGGLLEAVLGEASKLDDYLLTVPRFGELEIANKATLKTLVYYPPGFDESKKYPVMIYGYGGPGSQMARNTFGPKYYHRQRHLWFMYLAQQGYVVYIMDNRGTGGRGKAFKDFSYSDLSKYATVDHIAGARKLAGMPWVDSQRIGIWGWSFGGYLSLHALLRGNDVFKMAISVAPASDFRWYDTIYTERYMGLPQENRAGYDSASVFSYLDGYKGGLLLVHGSADDNVHLQHAMNLMRALQQKPAQFDVMIYPGLNHRLNEGNSTLHLYRMMSDYIKENL